ncbi:unnamed protein product [Victoria cruziana]
MNQTPTVKQLYSFSAHKGRSSLPPVAGPRLVRDASGVSSIFSTDNGGGTSEEENDEEDGDGGINGELMWVSEEMTFL